MISAHTDSRLQVTNRHSNVLLQTAAWETARLRVRATSMAAENDALKKHVAQLMHQISNMDRSVQVQFSQIRAATE